MKLLRGLLWAAAAMTVWEILSRTGVVSQWAMPPPSRLPAEFWNLLRTGELGATVGRTLLRVLVAFVLGSTLGFAAGAGAASYQPARALLSPVFSGLFSLPKMALLPMAMVIFGIGEFSRGVPALVACFAVTALHGMDAVAGVRREFVEMARSCGARGWALVRCVLIPSCLPPVFAGMRLAMGMALVMVVSVEMVGQPSGLGGMIWVAGQSMAIEKLFVGVLVASLLGSSLLEAMRWMERRCVPWAHQRGE